MENLINQAKTTDGPEIEEQPRKTRIILPLRSIIGRAWSNVIDFLVFVGGGFCIVDLNVTAAELLNRHYTEGIHFVMLQMAVFTLWFVACVLFRDAWGQGRSIGKRFCNLRIYTLRTSRPTFVHAMLRQSTIFIPMLVFFVHLYFIDKATDSGEIYIYSDFVLLACVLVVFLEGILGCLGIRRLGDLIAGTKIVYSRQDGFQKPYFKPRYGQKFNGPRNGGYRRFND